MWLWLRIKVCGQVSVISSHEQRFEHVTIKAHAALVSSEYNAFLWISTIFVCSEKICFLRATVLASAFVFDA